MKGAAYQPPVGALDPPPRPRPPRPVRLSKGARLYIDDLENRLATAVAERTEIGRIMVTLERQRDDALGIVNDHANLETYLARSLQVEKDLLAAFDRLVEHGYRLRVQLRTVRKAERWE